MGRSPGRPSGPGGWHPESILGQSRGHHKPSYSRELWQGKGERGQGLLASFHFPKG